MNLESVSIPVMFSHFRFSRKPPLDLTSGTRRGGPDGVNRPLLKRIKKDVENLDETTDAVDEDKIPEVVSRVSS